MIMYGARQKLSLVRNISMLNVQTNREKKEIKWLEFQQKQ